MRILRSMIPIVLGFVIHSFAAVDYDYAAVYFDGQNNTGLRVAGSNDGLNWTVISSISFKPDVGDWHQFRDPSFDKGPDSVYHLAWTTGGNGFGHATSRDLIQWSSPEYIRIDKGILSSGTTMTWAPEVFYDSLKKNFCIVFSSSTRNISNCMWAGNFKGYYITTTDWKSFTTPKLLLNPDNAYWMIDGALLHAMGKYYYFVKIEDLDTLNGCQSKDGIHYASATTIDGPWTSLSTNRLPGNEANSEAPSPIKIGDYYYVYYDKTEGMKAARSKDLVNWEDATNLLKVPPSFRHGTIRQIRKSPSTPVEIESKPMIKKTLKSNNIKLDKNSTVVKTQSEQNAKLLSGRSLANDIKR